MSHPFDLPDDVKAALRREGFVEQRDEDTADAEDEQARYQHGDAAA